MKSIIIFGKGPSVLRCTKKIVDEYNDIAICNYPVLNNFFKNLINDREIKYHFANFGTFDERYNDQTNKKLKIKNIYNTNLSNNYIKFLKNHSLIRSSIRESLLKYFKIHYDLDPNTGTMALKFILDLKEYNKICLVGFDNFEIGKQEYYFKPKDYNKKLKYLIDNNIVTKEGIFNIVSLHCPIKTKKYFIDILKKNQDIQFNLITDMKLGIDLSNTKLIGK